MGYFKFGFRLALAFFLVGTSILIWFAITLSTQTALLAYQFTIIAIVVNWIYAGFLLFDFLRKKIDLLTLFKTLGVMSFNIPIGIFYAWLMVVFVSYARITIRNTLGQDVTSVQLKGCIQTKKIPELKRGEQHTVWLKLPPQQCDVVIHYQFQGVGHTEVIANRLTQGPDAILTHELRK
jgi:hypothetical protein